MISDPKEREKLYDDIRRECKVSFDGGVCVEIKLQEDESKKLKSLVENYILKTLESFYGTSYNRENFLVEYYDDILELPNRTPNGAFYPKVENIDEYNEIQSHVNDILINSNLVNQFDSFDLTTVRIVDGRKSKADSRLSATSRVHSDAWAGHNGDAILTIGVLGDETTSLEFNKIVGEVKPSFFETQHDYASASNLFEGYELISNLKFDTITIFDHACLHRTLKTGGGLRVSLDVGLKLNSSSGISKQKDDGRKMTKIEIEDILKIGKETFVKANETLDECYNRFKDDKYNKVPVSYIHDTIEIG
tara:strand:+ start:87 stop:1004 length:918 start_codon:yes stop_codon:yes gene_type:complete